MSNFNNYKNSKAIQEFTRLWTKIINNKLYRTLLGAFAGAVIGFLYWKFIGCTSGTCPLTSNPFSTTILFGVMGGLFASDKKSKPELADNKNEQI
jgi:hypothetical protein